MRKFANLLSGAVLAFAILSAPVLYAAQIRETLEKSVAFVEGGTASIVTVNGDINVTSWDKAEVYVRADVRVKAGSEEIAEALFKETELKVEVNGTSVEIYIDTPKLDDFEGGGVMGWLFGEGRPSVNAAFEVKVPFKTSVSAKSTNGSVITDSLIGNANLQTTNGKIEAGAIMGSAEFRSTNGKISARQVAGGVFAHTTNGGIDILLNGEGTADQKIECITTNGGIFIQIPKPLMSDVNARTTNGGVTVELSEVVGANIFLSTSNGGIVTDFPLTIEGEISKHKIEGTIGAGGREIRLRTTNGPINLVKFN